VLDAFHDRALEVTVCRQEGGAAMMAEAVGKATGRPGICFVTRGPGATNASAGIHIAQQDSTPMIMFVGLVTRDVKDREALQELDLRAVFGSMTKWTAEIDDPARVPEIVSRAFYTATSGRPGPVVLGLPEDMLTERTAAPNAAHAGLRRPALPSRALLSTSRCRLRRATGACRCSIRCTPATRATSASAPTPSWWRASRTPICCYSSAAAWASCPRRPIR
jgi:thiamine pyrophosphate-dependent acetolactate synthase large subunit-like protein